MGTAEDWGKFMTSQYKTPQLFFKKVYFIYFLIHFLVFCSKCHNTLMWKIRESIDIIRRNSKSHKNVLAFLASLRRDSACSESEIKMADGAEEVSKKQIVVETLK